MGGEEGQDHEARLSHCGPLAFLCHKQQPRKGARGGKSRQFPSTHETLLFFQVPFQALVTFMQTCDVVVNTARPRSGLSCCRSPRDPAGARSFPRPACWCPRLASLETVTHRLRPDLHCDTFYISLITRKEARVSGLPLTNYTPPEWSAWGGGRRVC